MTTPKPGAKRATVEEVKEEVAAQVANARVTVDEVEQSIDISDQSVEDLAEATDKKANPVATKHEQGEESLTARGQRGINLMWETTQRAVALGVTGAALGVGAWLAVTGDTDTQTAAFVFLYGAANLVIGFYFGRTNHTRSSGVAGTTKGR